MPNRRFRILFWSIVSVVIHLIYFMGITFVPDIWTTQDAHSKQKNIEIEVLTDQKAKPKKQEQLFVRQTETEDNFIQDSKEKARFKSEKEQRVLLETRAKNVGLTKNRTAAPKFLNPPKEKISEKGTDYSEYKPLDIKKELKEIGPSTVGESLPQDVSVGSFTALNTDRFSYYTFYARIEDLIRFRWETKIKESLDSFNHSFLVGVVLKKNWITQVEFLLTANGEIHQAKIIKASGVAQFDQAPIWAFRDARLFPNPPADMVESDGFIHLNYSFNVQLNPNGWAER